MSDPKLHANFNNPYGNAAITAKMASTLRCWRRLLTGGAAVERPQRKHRPFRLRYSSASHNTTNDEAIRFRPWAVVAVHDGTTSKEPPPSVKACPVRTTTIKHVWGSASRLTENMTTAAVAMVAR